MIRMLAASRQVARCVAARRVVARGLSTTALRAAASNFAMPAMSPTMTEGGIVEWKFKEGDSFSAGDVLLEIETDKAQIDVEAQDDGVIAKIYLDAGSKGVPVGKTIAAIAEPGDDVSSLELPTPQEGGAASSSAQEKQEPAKEETPAEAKPAEKKEPAAGKSAAAADSGKADPNQTLLPSVSSLLQAHGVSAEDAFAKIPASGPKGRLLKGDVLAFLGKVSQESIDSVTSQIKKLQHLDLSNIKVREAGPASKAAKDAPKQEEQAAAAKDAKLSGPKPEPFKTVSVTVPLEGVAELQETIQEAFGGVALSSLVEKAASLAVRDAIRLSKPAPSVLRDPDFEYLLAPRTSKVPFTYSFEIGAPAMSRASQNEAFDFLTSGPARRVPRRPAAPAVPSDVTVDVRIDNSVPGAHHKADIFVSQLKHYLGEGKGELVL